MARGGCMKTLTWWVLMIILLPLLLILVIPHFIYQTLTGKLKNAPDFGGL